MVYSFLISFYYDDPGLMDSICSSVQDPCFMFLLIIVISPSLFLMVHLVKLLLKCYKFSNPRLRSPQDLDTGCHRFGISARTYLGRRISLRYFGIGGPGLRIYCVEQHPGPLYLRVSLFY